MTHVRFREQLGGFILNWHANHLYIMDIFHVLDMRCALLVSNNAPCFAMGLQRKLLLAFHKNHRGTDMSFKMCLTSFKLKNIHKKYIYI